MAAAHLAQSPPRSGTRQRRGVVTHHATSPPCLAALQSEPPGCPAASAFLAQAIWLSEARQRVGGGEEDEQEDEEAGGGRTTKGDPPWFQAGGVDGPWPPFPYYIKLGVVDSERPRPLSFHQVRRHCWRGRRMSFVVRQGGSSPPPSRPGSVQRPG
ncbi:unnamed protein product [Prorocentrum cordatum]|uniref:Inositol-pentakisphosphate 2-kinase n=1 Tax=Prorocentrum cordatum TaxID=2364126 RepID=A0ABN9XSE0_9DINO|nr:unnamed protein product [Polarella glacialis]